MKGIRLNFNDKGKAIMDSELPIEDFDSTIQNVVVTVASEKNSDRIYPKKGSYIYNDAVKGGLFNIDAVHHACNFASLDVFNFFGSSMRSDVEERINTLSLEPEVEEGSSVVTIKISAQSTLGNYSNLTLDI